MIEPRERDVRIPLGPVTLHGDLGLPPDPRGLVVFAHGSGSSRKSPRNRDVASALQRDGLATLLFDLLTLEEESLDRHTAHLRFDIEFLAGRLVAATRWARGQRALRHLPLGYFGASTGAAAALVAAAEQPNQLAAIVSRGGRPDLAGPALQCVRAPTLLIVGGADPVVIGLNERARALMRGEVELRIVPGASHLFEEPGALEEVARLASDWFTRYFVRRAAA
jgi:putative phosphoribosyl transferase